MITPHDVSPELYERISGAVFGFVDLYAVSNDDYQLEVFGKGERTVRRLEMAGFEVTGFESDWLRDQPYALVQFREKAALSSV